MTVRKAGVLLLVLLTLMAFSSCKQILDEAAREAAEKDKEHYVSFNPGKGHWIDNGTSETRIQYVRHGGYAMNPGPVELFGHEFVGWKINNSYYDFSDPVTGNLVYGAHWEPMTITVPVWNAGISLKLEYDSENDGLKIVGYEPTGNFQGRELVISENQFSFEGRDLHIVSIGSRTFEYDFKTKFTTIRLPDTVKEIADQAFYDCYAENIYIPDSVEKMGSDVFHPYEPYSTNLKMTVHLPYEFEGSVPDGWEHDWKLHFDETYVSYKYDYDVADSNQAP